MSLDETRPTDTETILNWPGIIRAIATYVNSLAALVGGDFSRQVSAQNVSATISTFNKIYYVNSASAVELTLDPMVTGEWVRIYKWGAGDLTVTPDAGDAIADAVAGTSIANTTAAEAKSAMIDLECLASGVIAVKGMLGTWA